MCVLLCGGIGSDLKGSFLLRNNCACVNLLVDIVKYICFIFFYFALVECMAQPKEDIVHSLSGQFQYSNIWTERGSLQQFTQNHPWMAQLDYGIVKNTQSAWNYCNCYTQNGLSLGYINFGNPVKLGSAFTFSSFTEPYLLHSKRTIISLRGSAGLAFLNKVYDSLTNKDDIFFSTKLSFLLGLGINISYRVNNYFSLKASAQFNHISNGGRKDPNEGMNFPGFSMGLEYHRKQDVMEHRAKEPYTEKSWGTMVHLFGNQRTAWPDRGWPEEKRLVLGLNVGLIKRIGRMNAIGPGAELYYDGINSVFQQRSGQILQTTAGAVNFQHYFFLGKLLLGQQLAWYVTSNTGFQKNLYQRYLIEYEIKKSWYAGFSLKAHGDRSDYFAFSTGYFIKI